ncbi:MAG: spore maturation protein [Clostridiales bacterium]|nr:spore maturation protein [Clostridiales bacterium]
MIAATTPLLILAVIGLAAVLRVDVFSTFVEGAGNALPLLKKLIPVMASIMLAIAVFRDSGALGFLTNFLAPAVEPLGLDARLLPLLLVRPFSGSAAIAAATEIFSQYGPDSQVGFTAGILVGASETIFYTIALYFGAVGVKKTRFAIPVALAAMLAAVVSGVIFSNLFYR